MGIFLEAAMKSIKAVLVILVVAISTQFASGQVYQPYPTLTPIQTTNTVYQGKLGVSDIYLEIMESGVVLKYIELDDVRRVDQYGRPVPPQYIVKQTFYPSIRLCGDGSYKLVFTISHNNIKMVTSCLVFNNGTITGSYRGTTVNRDFNGNIFLTRM